MSHLWSGWRVALPGGSDQFQANGSTLRWREMISTLISTEIQLYFRMDTPANEWTAICIRINNVVARKIAQMCELRWSFRLWWSFFWQFSEDEKSGLEEILRGCWLAVQSWKKWCSSKFRGGQSSMSGQIHLFSCIFQFTLSQISEFLPADFWVFLPEWMRTRFFQQCPSHSFSILFTLDPPF